MTLSPKDAERALLARYGEPAKDPTDYVIGFRTYSCKIPTICSSVKRDLRIVCSPRRAERYENKLSE